MKQIFTKVEKLLESVRNMKRMLNSTIETLNTVNDTLKLYKGEKISRMLSGMFKQDEADISLNKAKSELNRFISIPMLDYHKTEFDGVWGAIELIQHYEAKSTNQEEILINPRKAVNEISKIRVKNLLKDFFNKYNEKEYTLNSIVDLKLLKDFDKFAIDVFENENGIDLSDDDLPF